MTQMGKALTMSKQMFDVDGRLKQDNTIIFPSVHFSYYTMPLVNADIHRESVYPAPSDRSSQNAW